MRYARIVRYAVETPWAVMPETLRAMAALLAERADGVGPSREQIGEALGAREARAAAEAAARQQAGSQPGGVAVLPLFGLMVQRADTLQEMSGATSVERVGAAFRAAVADSNVGAIALQVDSPGGSVYGVDELAAEVYRARGAKPIVAVADSLAASAAYWVATAAEELVVTPGGEVGSIGVYSAHEDVSRALEAAGVTVTFVSAGKYKVEGNPYEPLGEEARAAMQGRVDDYYTMFTRAVARNRAAPVERVRDAFGEGRVVGARRAVELGMADRVATMAEVIDDLARGRYRKRDGQAAADDDLDRRRRRLRLSNR